jgi:hypothetical protein
MNRERNRPGSGRSDDQSPSTPRPGNPEVQREEEEEEESGNRIVEDEESSPMGQKDQNRDRSPN